MAKKNLFKQYKGFFFNIWKSFNVMNYINRKRKKNNMITSIDRGKVFDNVIKKLNELEIEVNFLNMVKDIYRRPNITVNNERLNVFHVT